MGRGDVRSDHVGTKVWSQMSAAPYMREGKAEVSFLKRKETGCPQARLVVYVIWPRFLCRWFSFSVKLPTTSASTEAEAQLSRWGEATLAFKPVWGRDGEAGWLENITEWEGELSPQHIQKTTPCTLPASVRTQPNLVSHRDGQSTCIPSSSFQQLVCQRRQPTNQLTCSICLQPTGKRASRDTRERRNLILLLPRLHSPASDTLMRTGQAAKPTWRCFAGARYGSSLTSQARGLSSSFQPHQDILR